MAVGPSLPRDPRVGVPAQRGLPPAIIRAKAGVATRSGEPPPERPGLAQRLRTAVTDDEIDGQIMRMFKMLARGLIDMAAPRGSYLNILS